MENNNSIGIPMGRFMKIINQTYLPNQKYVLVSNQWGVKLHKADVPRQYLSRLKPGQFGFYFGITNSEGKFDEKCFYNCNIKIFV